MKTKALSAVGSIVGVVAVMSACARSHEPRADISARAFAGELLLKIEDCLGFDRIVAGAPIDDSELAECLARALAAARDFSPPPGYHWTVNPDVDAWSRVMERPRLWFVAVYREGQSIPCALVHENAHAIVVERVSDPAREVSREDARRTVVGWKKLDL